MGQSIKYTTIAFVVIMIGLSSGFAISPQLDPVDKCIYTCIYCFKDNVGVICANECLATEGKMHSFWFKSCPQLSPPNLFWKTYDIEDDSNNSEELTNVLH